MEGGCLAYRLSATLLLHVRSATYYFLRGTMNATLQPSVPQITLYLNPNFVMDPDSIFPGSMIWDLLQ